MVHILPNCITSSKVKKYINIVVGDKVKEVAVYISFHRHIFRNARDLVKYAHIFHFTVESTAPYCNL